MTKIPGVDGGQIAYEVTGLTATAEKLVAARAELVWDLVADVRASHHAWLALVAVECGSACLGLTVAGWAGR